MEGDDDADTNTVGRMTSFMPSCPPKIKHIVRPMAKLISGSLFDFLTISKAYRVFPNLDKDVLDAFARWYSSSGHWYLQRVKPSYTPQDSTLHVRVTHGLDLCILTVMSQAICFWNYRHVIPISFAASDIANRLNVDQWNPPLITKFSPPYNTAFLAPSLSIHTLPHTAYAPANNVSEPFNRWFPNIVLETATCPTNDPEEILRYWQTLYRSRDIWLMCSYGKVSVAILVLFIINPETNKATARMDIWRHDPRWQHPKLTDDFVLFPPPEGFTLTPPDGEEESRTNTEGRDVEKVAFSAREIFGSSPDINLSDAKITAKVRLVLDINQTRRELVREFNTHNRAGRFASRHNKGLEFEM
ncbi:hypothetical protein H072_996 [Dactylellina haptotyla CBS 200.50]|uniref:Uncharacterized protein n=1 Tax=Dactylellina haptotyla (strain CBS 200.50) TaxID=1284197 RepID=S8CBK4_DACHA|nr:hypothetical protein H072_996 [Dactylellina haptotyla CBS 200.50]